MTSAHWVPGIGDPTFAGWLTVVAYFCAALLCARAGQAKWIRGAAGWQWWYALTVLMVLLGINKQLDLQVLLTDIGRDIATAQGWYAERRKFQLEFIIGLAVAGLVSAFVVVFTVGRKLDRWGRLSILATCSLGVFIMIRAASFHYVDRMLGVRTLGLRFNTIMELGPLLLINFAAWGARRSRRSADVRR